MSSRRTGAILADALVALVLLGILGLVGVRLLVSGERLARTVLEHGARAAALHGGAAFLRRELEGLGRDSGGSDLLALGSDSVTYRAMRLAGLACTVTTAEVRIRLDQARGWRLPQPGRDSVLVPLFSDSGMAVPRHWIAGPIQSLAPASCGGAPALALRTTLDSARLAGTPLPALVPVRTFEIMQLRLYQSLGQWWLGARSVSAGEPTQPVHGPLDPAGLRLTGLDSSGRAVPGPASVRSLSLVLAASGDSVALNLAPRNLGPP
ncbi:MAG TPA: hypothetical protein VNJ71_02300 [Gemmatimonadales bacterium]|nr:hypothetical protein [Gemmatimonadales bacterium]